MHDGHGPVTTHHLDQPFAVADVALFERPEPDHLAMAEAQIVVGDRLVARLGQGLAGVAADVAGAAGDQH